MTDAISQNEGAPTELLDELVSERPAEKPASGDESEQQVNALLEQVDLPRHPEVPLPPLFSANLAALPEPRKARLRRFPGQPELYASVAAGVERDLLEWAFREHQRVLVELHEDTPTIVGVVQTRYPTELKLRAANIELDATRELFLRSGRAGMKLRADGEVELVGSRISAASRGLFRLVGRILRLN